LILDFTRLRRGELITGLAGVGLLVVMLAFSWFAVKVSPSPGSTVMGFGRNAFESFTLIDLVLLATALLAIASPLVSASQDQFRLRHATAVIVCGLGIAAVILIAIRIASPPDLAVPGGHVSDINAEVVRRVGVWLGLLTAIGVVAGSGLTMRTVRAEHRLNRATNHRSIQDR
jgi:hypothetical protein